MKVIPGSIFQAGNNYCVPKDKGRLLPLLEGGYFVILEPGWSLELARSDDYWR